MNDTLLAKLSTLFGWQLAGWMTTENDLQDACDQSLSNVGGGRWEDMGLDVAKITGR